VRSEIDNGTTFRIFFPITVTTAKTGTEVLSVAQVHGGKETILVVEDEPALRELVRGILEIYGYRVLEAIHGKEALVVWAKHKEEIDLLLTDMVMPEGVSGLDLAETLRKEDPTLRIIYTSGYSMDLFSGRQKMAEGVNFLPKPYQPKVLAKMIRDSLDA
jgi:two-component system cell cycle sensor histidine kinase/response regulator CckA